MVIPTVTGEGPVRLGWRLTGVRLVGRSLGFGGSFGHGQADERPAELLQIRRVTPNGPNRDIALPTGAAAFTFRRIFVGSRHSGALLSNSGLIFPPN
jgi:hypothetical protein